MSKIDQIASDEKAIGGDIARNLGEKRQPITSIAIAEQPGGDQQPSSIPDRDIQVARRRANARVIKDAIGTGSNS